MSEVGRLIVQQIPGLSRYARALVSDCAQADDLVQDCLERAWSRLHLWEPETNIRTERPSSSSERAAWPRTSKGRRWSIHQSSTEAYRFRRSNLEYRFP